MTQQQQYQASQVQGYSSTPDPQRSGLVWERVKSMASLQVRQEEPRTPDPHRGLVGDRSHPDINTLL